MIDDIIKPACLCSDAAVDSPEKTDASKTSIYHKPLKFYLKEYSKI